MKFTTPTVAALAAGALAVSALAVTSVTSGAAGATGTGAAAAAAARPLAQQPGSPPPVRLDLKVSSARLATCFPKARARVTVDRTTDRLGKDTFTIAASGLRPRTGYTVFLLEKAAAPFGAAEYIGDFTTDRNGKGANRFTLIVEEAFAFNNTTGSRTDLNAVGFWFADPKDDDGCLGANSPVTGFDGDAEAGVQMMNSGNALLP